MGEREVGRAGERGREGGREREEGREGGREGERIQERLLNSFCIP